MRDTNIYTVREAIQHITRTIQLNNESSSQQSPYFFIAGAGISAPNVPSANMIIEKCKKQVNSVCSSDEFQNYIDTIGSMKAADQYSSWMALAFPNKIDRSNFFREQIKNAGITSANLLLAQILCSKKVATTVLTPNFDDILKQSMDLLGQRNVLVAENSMDNLSITPYNQEELQIVHVHGTYRFYDCANLNSEILEVTNKNGTLSSTQLLRNFLQVQAPIIIGYSGWESDVIMTCLAERLSYPVPRSYIWVCYTQEDYMKLPDWLKSNKDVIFVMPDSCFGSETSDIIVNAERKDASFGDEYVKQQYTQNVDAADFFYKLISNLGVAEPAIFTNPSNYYKNLSENILPKDQYSWHLRYWAEKMHGLTAQKQPVEQAIRQLEAALVDKDFGGIVQSINDLSGMDYANTAEDADFVCSTLFPKILSVDFLVDDEDRCRTLCLEMLSFQEQHANLIKDRSVLQHKILGISSKKPFFIEIMRRIHQISQKQITPTLDELFVWGDIIFHMPQEEQLSEFDKLINVCQTVNMENPAVGNRIRFLAYIAMLDRAYLLPINEAIAEYNRVREELIPEDDTKIYRLYGLNTAVRIAQKANGATLEFFDNILCDLEEIVDYYHKLYKGHIDDPFIPNKCYSCISNLLIFNCAELVGVNNIIGRIEYILSKIAPADEKKDHHIRQMLSMLMCYYPTDIITDQKKIQILSDLFRDIQEYPYEEGRELFDCAIVAAYSKSSNTSLYHERFPREQLDGAVLSNTVDKYCDGSTEEAQMLFLQLLDSPLEDVRKLAAGNLAYMVRRNEAPYITHSFEELVELADANNSTLQVNILLYCAINKKGEVSDLCRQAWHAFCQLTSSERKSAAEWWEKSEVVGTKEQRLVLSLLRYADTDVDLPTMLARIGEESGCGQLVGALT